MSFMDAPVTGSSPKAEDGTLTIMAGGEQRDFERARPLFEAMGELVVHVGPVGQGQLVKVINNAVAAANTAVAAEALLAGKRAGADLDALVKVIGAGSGASAMLELKPGPMRSHDYTTLFKLEHMLKDLRLCLEEAEAAGVRMELVEDDRRDPRRGGASAVSASRTSRRCSRWSRSARARAWSRGASGRAAGGPGRSGLRRASGARST